MLHSYLKIAYRNLLRQKAFSVINIAGLATGMACSILILLWVQDELSYDRFHAHADRIYRVNTEMNGEYMAISTAPLAPALVQALPEVEDAVRLTIGFAGAIFAAGDRSFDEKEVMYADSNFLQVFSFPLLHGNPSTALSRPNSLLLTEKSARKYFGKTDAVGQTLLMDNQHLFTVMGVLQDNPGNSYLQFDLVLPVASLGFVNPDQQLHVWSDFEFISYLLLQKSFTPTAPALADLEDRMNGLYRQNEKGMNVKMSLQPLPDIRLHSNGIMYNIWEVGNIQYVRIFSVVAVFILLVACINFMNLATARSARRAKEVGLRKVIGARWPQLVRQFLGESVLLTGLALVLAVVVVELALPVFNEISGKKLAVDYLSAHLWLGLLGIGLLTGLLSGSYPALFLSSFQPVKVLKGTLQLGGGNVLFRNGLVVTQFVVSIVLIVGTAVVYGQLHHIKNINLGYNKENLLYVPLTRDLKDVQVQALRAELERHSATQHFTFASHLPTGLTGFTTGVDWEGKEPGSQPSFAPFRVEPGFVEVFGMQLRNGRDFSLDLKTDTAGYILNEQAVRVMGLHPDSAVGFKFSFWQQEGTVIGVVKDFNFKPVHHPIEPLIMHMRNNDWGYLVVRAQPGSLQETAADLEQVWNQVNRIYPFTYGFLDQDLEQQYRAEERMGQIFNAFSLLAIFISCLGLYGLAAFTAEQRTKEIGIRKVLGASVANIVGLLSKNFVKLVGVAILIALPLAWYAMGRWLEEFAYRIDLEWWVFALAAGLALLIALLTVSFQSVKAALANPVKSLKANE